jgi:hypothetical protein
MPNPDQQVERFLGGDPIAGTQALQDLLALGEEGEEALFSLPIGFPKTVQVRRRWLRYVASRETTVIERLLDRMRNQDRFKDAHSAAYLFAGLSRNRTALNALYSQFEHERLTSLNYDPVSNRFEAWGYAGGSAAALWNYVRDNDFAWEKLATFAFRAACASAARINADDLWAIERLITHQRTDYSFTEIDNSPDAKISHQAVDGSELWGQANDVFVTWRRGEVADKVLRQWSVHSHWRVRDFGAQVLASLGFQRTVAPIDAWLRREPLRGVRLSLLHALERSDTPAAADALLEHFDRASDETWAYLPRVGSYATDKKRAVTALSEIADDDDVAAAEALVALARLGHRHERLMESLDAHDPYRRLNAALGVAYLGDAGARSRLSAMQREAAAPIERVFLAAALAMLAKPDGVTELAQELGTAASASDYEQRVDLFFMHRYLQTAVLDALGAAGAHDEPLTAWRAEMEALKPIPQPVAAAPAPKTVTALGQLAAAGSPQPAKGARRGGVADEPLKVFISYSHQDEKMRRKLGQHLAALVNDRLIQIWHDRAIEAGADWEGEINREIDEADLILLLVSAAFLDSPYCRRELVRALEKRSAGQSLPIPIILRPCDWTSVFNRADYKTQALPRDDRPVAGGWWPNQDAAFATIAKELRTTVERMRGSARHDRSG